MAKKIPLSPAAIDSLTDGSLSDLLTLGLTIEVLESGKTRWRYRRQVAGTKVVATLFDDLYPGRSIADARAWNLSLNEKVESGIDQRVFQKKNENNRILIAEKMCAYYT